MFKIPVDFSLAQLESLSIKNTSYGYLSYHNFFVVLAAQRGVSLVLSGEFKPGSKAPQQSVAKPETRRQIKSPLRGFLLRLVLRLA